MEKLTNKIFYTSWGYDMTHNDYVLVLSETEKSCMVQMIGNKKLTGGGYTGEEVPDTEKKFGSPFRLLKRSYKWGEGDTYLKGSYPFCLGDMSAKRLDSFRVWNGRPSYYNTMD